MTSEQITLAIAPTVLPTLTVLVGILVSNRQIDALRLGMDRQIGALRLGVDHRIDTVQVGIRELREDVREIRIDIKLITIKLITGKLSELDTSIRFIEEKLQK